MHTLPTCLRVPPTRQLTALLLLVGGLCQHWKHSQVPLLWEDQLHTLEHLQHTQRDLAAKRAKGLPYLPRTYNYCR